MFGVQSNRRIVGRVPCGPLLYAGQLSVPPASTAIVALTLSLLEMHISALCVGVLAVSLLGLRDSVLRALRTP